MLLQEDFFFLKVARPKYFDIRIFLFSELLCHNSLLTFMFKVFIEIIYLTVFEDDHPVGVSVVCSFPAIWIKSDVTVDKM